MSQTCTEQVNVSSDLKHDPKLAVLLAGFTNTSRHLAGSGQRRPLTAKDQSTEGITTTPD
jgi:hypothetical protein